MFYFLSRREICVDNSRTNVDLPNTSCINREAAAVVIRMKVHQSRLMDKQKKEHFLLLFLRFPNVLQQMMMFEILMLDKRRDETIFKMDRHRDGGENRFQIFEA